MPTKQQDEQPANQDKQQVQQAQQRLSDVIGRRVMHALGQPGDLHRVQVRRLWEDHYRVNVLIGADSFSARIAHSYFLVADEGGNIVAATPKVTRQYGPAAGG